MLRIASRLQAASKPVARVPVRSFSTPIPSLFRSFVISVSPTVKLNFGQLLEIRRCAGKIPASCVPIFFGANDTSPESPSYLNPITYTYALDGLSKMQLFNPQNISTLFKLKYCSEASEVVDLAKGHFEKSPVSGQYFFQNLLRNYRYHQHIQDILNRSTQIGVRFWYVAYNEILASNPEFVHKLPHLSVILEFAKTLGVLEKLFDLDLDDFVKVEAEFVEKFYAITLLESISLSSSLSAENKKQMGKVFESILDGSDYAARFIRELRSINEYSPWPSIRQLDIVQEVLSPGSSPARFVPEGLVIDVESKEIARPSRP